ncbi:LLM class flavin-dependent oxidoreductase [Azospirillum sp. ST 5-10]|uniref:LLM class flavin-dependent oxidoreductase n=1 Tax=unclassified Azospirillum TaxID=2630922 RepID=UPI003F4A5FC4
MAGKLTFGVRLTVQGEMGAASSGFAYALEMARIAEDLGYDSVWIPDHVENAHLDRSRPILEHWTTITAIGALTKRVRLGGHSLNNNLRHPGMTAKIAATLDHVTGGRVILAPGSGWFEAEARAYGLEWGSAADRYARMREAVEVMQKLFTEEVTTYRGRFYRFEEAYCNPKPVQSPWPPFWIAGDSPRTQEIVEAFADCWFMYSKAPDQVAGLVAPMRTRRGAQRPLEVAVSAVYLSGDGEDEVMRWARMYAKEREHRFPVPPTVEDVLDANLLGDEGRVRERLDQWIAAGVDHVVIQPMPPVDGMRRFGERILPDYA